ncbi:MAG: CPBP family intramembrane metalloprotease [Candidatus Electrothrix sp. AR3]|nr:CPBP family intramembrane metalloprotease [Candidatus Electrothrix sp. AR3]
MIKYLKNNLLSGYKVSPIQKIGLSLSLTLIFTFIALFIGNIGNLYRPQILNSWLIYILPLSLFIFPSFLEESFFRGILIPNNTKEKGPKTILVLTLISATLFTIWHPLNALTINLSAKEVFLNPYFLIIVFCLGVICSLSYIYSKSLWAPIIIHWTTTVIWVIFLGGRNLILE